MRDREHRRAQVGPDTLTSALTDRRSFLKLGLTGTALGLAAATLPGTLSVARPQPVGLPAGEAAARLKRETVQVLFADLQVPLVAMCKTIEPKALARSAVVLAKVASILELPMLFSVVPEAGGPPSLIPELAPYSNPGNTILRRLAGPFMDPATASALGANRRKTLVVAGFAAEVVVLQAVLDAAASGYAVEYVVDAIGSQSERTESAAFRHMELVGAIPTSVLSLTTRMAPDFFHDPGSGAFAALQPLLHPGD